MQFTPKNCFEKLLKESGYEYPKER